MRCSLPKPIYIRQTCIAKFTSHISGENRTPSWKIFELAHVSCSFEVISVLLSWYNLKYDNILLARLTVNCRFTELNASAILLSVVFQPARANLSTSVLHYPYILPSKACLRGDGEPRVGEVTDLAVVKIEPAFICNLEYLEGHPGVRVFDAISWQVFILKSVEICNTCEPRSGCSNESWTYPRVRRKFLKLYSFI